MRLARGDVLAEKVPVDVDGGIDLLHDSVGAAAEAPAPHFVAHVIALGTIRSTELLTPEDPTEIMTAPPHRSQLELRRRPLIAVGIVLIVGGAIAAAVYGIGAFKRNAADGACAGAVTLAQRIAPLARGEVAAFAVADTPLRVPNLAFRDGDGHERHLSDWQGRTVLLNLWATWCVPCRREMPALDALEA